MTGAQHYSEAERLIGYVKESENAPQACAQLLAEAQVHATLALAAATVEENIKTPNRGSWDAAFSRDDRR